MNVIPFSSFQNSDQIEDVYFVPTLAYTSPRNGPCAVAGCTLYLQLLLSVSSESLAPFPMNRVTILFSDCTVLTFA